ncbi:MAG: thiamine pyrophosphate-dependent enzyme [Candidatus Eisenbacteria bacterium]|nr:thiamine pyrophosphate-dependent enzyme [Candidatus Eisenbacteria bacterium]
MASLKELASREDLLSGGHRACAGCAMTSIVRQVLLVAGKNVVVSCATGCLEVTTTIFPYTAWRVPFIHSAFENSAATISGVETAYRSLRKQGKIKEDTKFIGFGGDGGTYDIGLQSLSGAMERGHKMLYICYDNEAYMNTGNQRSSATPFAADTTTCPVGCVGKGKPQFQKDLAAIITAHNIPYVAQACGSFWKDLTAKVEKALSANGPSFINVLSPCVLGWKYPTDETIEIGKLAVDTCFWPLYEVVEGNYRLTYVPSQKKPLGEWTKRQGRFRHLHEPGGEGLLEKAQREVDRKWEHLLAISEKPAKPGKQPKEASQ